MEPKGRGAKRRLVEVKDRMVYVPILLTLQVLLHNHVIRKEVSSDNTACVLRRYSPTLIQINDQYRSGYLSDFCDGEGLSQNRLFSSHHRAIQIMFYYDDLEVANPLGSKRTKHKLGKYTN